MLNTGPKIFFAGIFILLLTSCERRSCNNVVCPAGQSCTNGVCICNNGYEGANCQTLSSDKYVGNYVVYESCPYANAPGPSGGQYNTYISFNDPSYPYLITINNFMNMGPITVNIYTDASNQGNQLLIQNQNIGAMQVSGDGNYNPNTRQIILNVNYTFNFTTYQCVHTFNKQ